MYLLINERCSNKNYTYESSTRTNERTNMLFISTEQQMKATLFSSQLYLWWMVMSIDLFTIMFLGIQSTCKEQIVTQGPQWRGHITSWIFGYLYYIVLLFGRDEIIIIYNWLLFVHRVDRLVFNFDSADKKHRRFVIFWRCITVY